MASTSRFGRLRLNLTMPEAVLGPEDLAPHRIFLIIGTVTLSGSQADVAVLP